MSAITNLSLFLIDNVRCFLMTILTCHYLNAGVQLSTGLALTSLGSISALVIRELIDVPMIKATQTNGFHQTIPPDRGNPMTLFCVMPKSHILPRFASYLTSKPNTD